MASMLEFHHKRTLLGDFVAGLGLSALADLPSCAVVVMTMAALGIACAAIMAAPARRSR